MLLHYFSKPLANRHGKYNNAWESNLLSLHTWVDKWKWPLVSEASWDRDEDKKTLLFVKEIQRRFGCIKGRQHTYATSFVLKKKKNEGKKRTLDEHYRMMMMIMSSFKIRSTSDKCTNSDVANELERACAGNICRWLLRHSTSRKHNSARWKKKKKAFILHWEDLTWLPETLKGCCHLHIALVKTPKMVDTLAPLFTTLVVTRSQIVWNRRRLW